MDDSSHRGILLAGGTGSRLFPMTQVTSKHLLPVYDKPMIYYPLTTLMLAGVSEILIISTPQDLPKYQTLLGGGGQWGLALSYAEQPTAGGLAQALLIGAEFAGDRSVMLMLGDNIVFGRYDFLRSAVEQQSDDAIVFAYEVEDPSAYGVVEFGDGGAVVSLEEKPAEPRSRYAVPGLYLYPPGAADEAAALAPSGRGELEITDLNRRYLEQGRLRAQPMGRGTAWFDAGTVEDLLEAAEFIHAIQRRQGLIIGCPEEVAYRQGLIDLGSLTALISGMPDSAYRRYLEQVIR